MRVDLPHLISDRQYLFDHDRPPDEGGLERATPFGTVRHESAGPMYDGPVTERVAVVDFDAEKGTLRPGATFLPQGIGPTVGTYAVDDRLLVPEVNPLQLNDPSFVQVSTFATVLETIQLFDTILGRPVPWAFEGPQLLVVPRAGEMRNAFYERESQSLQFFEFTTESPPNSQGAGTRQILTALSHDIVAHETAHALLDGIAPDLYHAASPESLALHEAVADLAALALTLRNDMIVFSFQYLSSSTIDVYEALARVAEEVGRDLRRGEGGAYLRSADNQRTLRTKDHSRDAQGTPNLVDRYQPHECSQVLVGAVFQVLRQHAESLNKPFEKQIELATRHVFNLLFRALDHLPPGELTFADMARAVSATAGCYRPETKLAQLLRTELVARGVAQTVADLDAPEPPAITLRPAELRQLVSRDAAALAFLERHRDELGIPRGVTLAVRPRVRLQVAGWNKRPGPAARRVKVQATWHVDEDHDLGPFFGTTWRAKMGVTLVIDEQTGAVVSALCSDGSRDASEARGQMLLRWANEGLLVPDQDPRSRGIQIDARGDVMRLQGTARTLHITGYDSPC